MSLLLRPFCALYGGHDYRRHGNCLVCSFCGHKVVVK